MSGITGIKESGKRNKYLDLAGELKNIEDVCDSGLVSVFNDKSTFAGYLMPKPPLYADSSSTI